MNIMTQTPRCVLLYSMLHDLNKARQRQPLWFTTQGRTRVARVDDEEECRVIGCARILNHHTTIPSSINPT